MENTVQLTEIEQLLIGFLATSKAPEDIQAMAFILPVGDEQRLEMCRFLSKNPEATRDEILQMAHNISGK